MWNRIARFIIQYRLPLIIVIGLLTVVMGYYASRVQMSYDFARTVPLSDPDMIYFNKFKEQFGEDPDIDEVYDYVTSRMQDALDALAAERRFPVIG